MHIARFRTLLFGLSLLLIAGCSPQAIIQRVEQGRASPEPNVGGGMATPGSVEEAIQQVIARANSAQVDAIAAKDSALMRDTATDRYFREAQRINQELLDGGVTKIELVKLEWGPITVRGNAAEATTWETWATSAANGRSVQSRDRNLYRLVQQDGVWRIQSNEHPDQREQQESPPLRQRPQV